MSRANANITYTVTRYPAPLWYRPGPNGEKPYYTTKSVKHAEKLRKAGRVATLEKSNRILSPVPGSRVCSECESHFMPTNPNNWTCSIKCSNQRARKNKAKHNAKKAVAA